MHAKIGFLAIYDDIIPLPTHARYIASYKHGKVIQVSDTLSILLLG